MNRIVFLSLGFLPLGVAGLLQAAPVGSEKPEAAVSWNFPGDIRGAGLAQDEAATATLKIPALSEKEAGVKGEWRGIASVDLYAHQGGKEGSAVLEVIDPETRTVIASSKGSSSVPAPRASETILFSSEQGGAKARLAFDGDPKTSWHSQYGAVQPKPPHWIGLEFAEPQVATGVRYLPRQSGYSNGVARKWRVEVRQPGKMWAVVARGESDRATVEKDRKPINVLFDKPLPIHGFRFVVESDWSGGGFGTAGELTALGVKRPEPIPATPATNRIWVEIPAEKMAALAGKSVSLKVRHTKGHPVVLGPLRLSRLHTAPTKKLFGRSNGGVGPDRLGAGLLGFDGLSEHRQEVLTVLDVRPEGPAAKAGLVRGDAIVAVDSKPLSVNDLAPGPGWHTSSHEAVLGKATEAVLVRGGKTISLTLLRDGKLVDLSIALAREKAFVSLDPASDPVAQALLDDTIGFLVRTQREDGSWSGDIIRTTFSALALLATDDPEHLPRVQRAVEWSLGKYPTPDKYGNLGFWSGAYAGILYSEYHLRTGEERVLPHLSALRDWAVAGQHESIWKVPALGHGPSGLPYGNKALVAPACHLLVFEALAARCGMKSEIWELLLPYMTLAWSDPSKGGHGSLGYNQSYKDKGEFWSRSGLFAMAAQLRGEQPLMAASMASFMKGHHQWMRNSHAYGEPGGGLGLLGLHLVDPAGFNTVLDEYKWWFSLAWEPGYGLHFTTPHMGAPYMGEDDLLNAVYALVLQARKKTLHLTGKE